MGNLLLPIVLVFTGSYFLLRLRGGPLLHPVRAARILFSKSGAKREKSLRALMLALAGTLGVGNITGVAYGIAKGGAGVVFWLFLSGIFSSVVKFAESALAKDCSEENRGGMALLLRRTFTRKGILLSALYAYICLLLCLFMGTSLQSASVWEAIPKCGFRSPLLFSLFFSVLAFLFLRRGSRRAEHAVSFLIPIGVVLYAALCITVIVRHFDALPRVLSAIWEGAFTPSAAAGGILPIAVREGFARGLLSNEAGAGTSAMAHAHSDRDAVFEGLSGSLEAFFDTSFLCMLTAFTLLLSPLYDGRKMLSVSDVFTSEFGSSGGVILFLIIGIFAFSTVLCWYVYGAETFSFLFPRRRGKIFAAVFLSSLFLGPFLPLSYLVSASDVCLTALAFLTVPVLIKKADRLVFLSAKSGLIPNTVSVTYGFLKEDAEQNGSSGHPDPARTYPR